MVTTSTPSLDRASTFATARLGRAFELARSRGTYGALPPGPPDPALAQLPQFLFAPHAYLGRCREAFGPCFTLRFPRLPPVVMFWQPDAIRDVFSGSPEEFWAGEANFVLEPLLGRHSLLLLDGERHLAQRRLLTPPFRGDRMREYGATMRDVTREVIARYLPGVPMRFQEATQAITLDVILRTVFGVEDEASMTTLRRDLSSVIDFGMRPALLVPALQIDLGPESPWGRFRRARSRTRTNLLALVRRRRAEGRRDRTDVLSLLLEARHEDGSPMSDEEILDELMTLLAAGHETTATGLAWTARRLIENPDVQARAIAEVRTAFPDGVVDPDRVASLAYVRAVNQEALRIDPVVPGVGRRLHRDATIGGRHLPSGVVVALSVLLAHSNPSVFKEPQAFRPERFLERKPTPYEFLPFGGGVRRCIGMAFALYEMDVVLATILATHRFERASTKPVRVVRRGVTLAPSDGLPVVLRRDR